jgi:DNA-binding HxlR family transcriptional regulator
MIDSLAPAQMLKCFFISYGREVAAREGQVTMAKVNQQGIAAIQKAIQLISKKWSFPIISQLCYGPIHFNQLKQKFIGVSVTALRETLHHLERHRVINRQVYSTKPVCIEYSLSNEGREFIRVLLGIRKWSD